MYFSAHTTATFVTSHSVIHFRKINIANGECIVFFFVQCARRCLRVDCVLNEHSETIESSFCHFRFEIISIGAKKERQLKVNLSKMLTEWADISFTVRRWK
jgi:hypothetical protein